MAQNPPQGLFACKNLGDARHSGTEPVRRPAKEFTPDGENVFLILDRGGRGNPVRVEFECQVGAALERKESLHAGLDVLDFFFGDIRLDIDVLDEGHLEQFGTLVYGGADSLLQVAFDDDGAVGRSVYYGFGKLVAHRLQLGQRLCQAGLVDSHVGKHLVGLRFLDFSAVVLLFGKQVRLFELELLLVEPQEFLPLVHDVAGFYGDAVDEPAEGGGKVHHLVRLEDGGGAHLVLEREYGREYGEGDCENAEELGPGMLESEALGQDVPGLANHARTNPVALLVQLLQPGAGKRGYKEDFRGVDVGKGLLGPFAGDNGHDVVVVTYGYREQVSSIVLCRILLVGACQGGTVLGRREDYGGVLLVGLFHGRFQVLHNLHLLFETVGVAYGLELYVVVLEPADAHALGVQPVRNFAGEGEQCRLELVRLVDFPCDVHDGVELHDLLVRSVQRSLQGLDEGAHVKVLVWIIHLAGPPAAAVSRRAIFQACSVTGAFPWPWRRGYR